jgi:hypothetical protein
MAEKISNDPNGPVPSANELRLALLEKEMAELETSKKITDAEEQRRAAFAEGFLKNHVSDEERAIIRTAIMSAVGQGKMETLVYSFPSSLCTDRGRAINNGERDWPETLQGKAKELYDRYTEVARPQGYRLKAMIINFPGGIPGDVGFFLSWAPE